MSRAELSTGEAIVGLLEEYGVDTVFGIPGVHNVEMYRALPRSGITHILPRHEQGAGFMADGFARATGKPGICFIITGAGAHQHHDTARPGLFGQCADAGHGQHA